MVKIASVTIIGQVCPIELFLIKTTENEYIVSYFRDDREIGSVRYGSLGSALTKFVLLQEQLINLTGLGVI